MGQTEASQAPEGQGGGGEEGFDEEVEAFQESGRVFLIIGIYPVMDISRGRAVRVVSSLKLVKNFHTPSQGAPPPSPWPSPPLTMRVRWSLTLNLEPGTYFLIVSPDSSLNSK